MNQFAAIKDNIEAKGYSILDNVFDDEEINSLVNAIHQVDQSKQTVRKNAELFAIRQFLKEVPLVASIIFKGQIRDMIMQTFGQGFFVVKSIYFDKPGSSNWFVAYHQDLTISVDKKKDIDGFGPWTIKQDQFAVQPPLAILEDNFTIRFHLDDTTSENGALHVIPGSHRKGICRPETIDRKSEIETICPVKKGGMMIMKPLLLHASGRTINDRKRRVIHIEFSRSKLPGGLNWSEYLSVND